MKAVKMPSGIIIRIGQELQIVFDDGTHKATWIVKDISVSEQRIKVDQLDENNNLTQSNLRIPINMWEGAEVVEITADDVNNDPNLAFRLRRTE